MDSMSLSETSKLLEQSRKVMEQSQSQGADQNAVQNQNILSMLNSTLKVVTSTDKRVGKVEIDVKRVEQMNHSITAIGNKIGPLERSVEDLKTEISELKASVEVMSTIFDELKMKCESNEKSIAELSSKISDLESKNSETCDCDCELKLKSLQESVSDLRCRSINSNFVFNGINEVRNEDMEDMIRRFLDDKLGIR